MTTVKKLTFDEFCFKIFGGLYEPGKPQKAQCTGYTLLKKMVVEQIEPASLEEINRWENAPTIEELYSVPDIKYLRFLHPLLRLYVIEHWQTIKALEITQP